MIVLKGYGWSLEKPFPGLGDWKISNPLKYVFSKYYFYKHNLHSLVLTNNLLYFSDTVRLFGGRDLGFRSPKWLIIGITLLLGAGDVLS